jgi:hypothetical protein
MCNFVVTFKTWQSEDGGNLPQQKPMMPRAGQAERAESPGREEVGASGEGKSGPAGTPPPFLA